MGITPRCLPKPDFTALWNRKEAESPIAWRMSFRSGISIRMVPVRISYFFSTKSFILSLFLLLLNHEENLFLCERQ